MNRPFKVRLGFTREHQLHNSDSDLRSNSLLDRVVMSYGFVALALAMVLHEASEPFELGGYKNYLLMTVFAAAIVIVWALARKGRSAREILSHLELFRIGGLLLAIAIGVAVYGHPEIRIFFFGALTLGGGIGFVLWLRHR